MKQRFNKIVIFIAAFLAIVGTILIVTAPVEADEIPGAVRCGGTGELACIVATSPFVERHLKAGNINEVTWCVNQRGINYPGFVNDVAGDMAFLAENLGVPHRQVVMPASRSNTSCVIRHEMLDNHPCSGCGAWTYLLNYPIVTEYNAAQGFWSFATTVGHENGHNYCLLDEHYDQVNFIPFFPNYGYWIRGEPTVMDGGTGIAHLTSYDMRLCSQTLGRQVPLPEPPLFTYTQEQGLNALNSIERWFLWGDVTVHPFSIAILEDLTKGFNSGTVSYSRLQISRAIVSLARTYAFNEGSVHPYSQAVLMDLLRRLK